MSKRINIILTTLPVNICIFLRIMCIFCFSTKCLELIFVSFLLELEFGETPKKQGLELEGGWHIMILRVVFCVHRTLYIVYDVDMLTDAEVAIVKVER